MGGKQRKKRQARRNASKQKRNNTKKTPPAAKVLPPAEPNVVEEKSVVKEAAENGNREKRWRVVGLANLRNTCYFNSVLQLLLSSAFLQDCFTHVDLKAVIAPTSLTAAMCELFDLTLSNGEKRFQFKPNRVLTAVRAAEPLFKSRGQHDAHELLITLLHHLVEEAQRHEENGLNWMEDIFGGKLTSKITCTKCGYIKSREEDFLVLSISVTRDDASVAPAVTSPTSYALSTESVLPDVVERNDPEALAHLQPAPDQSSLQNNCVDDSASEAVQTDAESLLNDDMWVALHDLFTSPDEEEEEEEPPHSDTASCPVDCVPSLYDKEHPETANNELFTSKGRRKGKHKGRKKANRFDDLEFDVEEPKIVVDARRFLSIEECLQHFFSRECVTWRCAGEFPEKRVSFSEQPEVFVVPPSCDSRTQIRKTYREDLVDDAANDSVDESDEGTTDETPDAVTESTAADTTWKESTLKSCLKKKSREPLPPVPPLNSTKQYYVWKAPKVLCIHLKRFDALGQRRISKLAHSIKFETKMSVEHFVDPSSPFNSVAEYELKAVVCHSGSLSFGHYTAFASRTMDGEQQWYDVSDSDVRKASLSEVLNSQAYILLYEASRDERPCTT